MKVKWRKFFVSTIEPHSEANVSQKPLLTTQGNHQNRSRSVVGNLQINVNRIYVNKLD